MCRLIEIIKMIFQGANDMQKLNLKYVIDVLELHKKGLDECSRIFSRNRFGDISDREKWYHDRIEEINTAITQLRGKAKNIKKIVEI